MGLANQEAQRFNHDYIGTEHILLGLVKESSGTGAKVLENFGINLIRVRSEVNKLMKSELEIVTMGRRLPLTPRAKKVIEYAHDEAKNLKHDYVGTEHLLLGLLREQDGVAAQVLMNFNLRLEDLRDEVLKVLGASENNKQLPEPKSDEISLLAPQSVVEILNSEISVSGDGLITNKIRFSELNGVELRVGLRKIHVTPHFAACLIAASLSKPSGYATALTTTAFLEFMKGS